MSHNHCSKCKHTSVKYCECCDVVYCTSCSKEWNTFTYNWDRYLKTGQITLGNGTYTTGLISKVENNTATPTDATDREPCKHGDK